MEDTTYRKFRSVLGIAAFMMLLASCSGGDVVTGAGVVGGTIDALEDASDVDVPVPPICGGNVSGDWRGNTSNGGVILLTLRQNNACGIQGEAAFPPCLTVSPIRGNVLLFGQSFSLETIDGSLFVERIENIDIDNNGLTEKGSYRFKNLQNVANCPQSETGSVKFIKIS